MSETSWRAHPKLAKLFHPGHPDDLQVLIHEGGPRITRTKPELMWVRVTGMADGACQGTLLNLSAALSNVRQGDTIRFVPPTGNGPPIYVTEKYLRERGGWVIQPCDRCGNAELFDAPSDLVRVIFPNLPDGAVPAMFTSFCPLCGGVQVVAGSESAAEVDHVASPRKRWWEFWK